MLRINDTTFTTERGGKRAVASVSIGGKDPTKFLPNINSSKWGDEAWINLNVPSLIALDQRPEITEDNKISCQYGDFKFVTYDHSSLLGVLEVEIILGSRVALSELRFTIKDSGNLIYSYQRGLTAEELAAGRYREPNVVGSYAIYIRDKINNEYATGKFCHLYRWEAIATDGKRAWCDELKIDNGELIIGLPVEFLRVAQYPVRLMGAGDTIGYETIGASYDSIEGVILAAAPYTAGSSGQATTISAALRESLSNNAHSVKTAAYNNSTDALIGSSNERSDIATTANVWYDFTVDFAVTSGVTYALAAWCGLGDGAIRLYSDDLADYGKSDVRVYTSWPDPAVWDTDPTNKRYSVHMDYTAASTVPVFMYHYMNH